MHVHVPNSNATFVLRSCSGLFCVDVEPGEDVVQAGHQVDDDDDDEFEDAVSPTMAKAKAAAPSSKSCSADDGTAEVDLSALKSAPGVNCSGKAMPADKITYNDDGFLGKKLPDLDSLEWFQGADEAKAALCSPKNKVVIFWAKFAKGDWKATIHHFNELSKKHPNVEFLGISCDPKKEEAL